LLAGAIDLADQIITSYEENFEALAVAIVVTVAGVLSGGLGFIAATGAIAGGAIAAVGAAAGGASALVGGAYQIDQIAADLAATNSDELIDSLSSVLSDLESAFHLADDEIAAEIQKVQSDWGTAKIAIPAPPGSDEVNPESFRHESSY
jgi:hypothetical protein